MKRDRMFQVLVLGGIGLVGACGGTTSSSADAGPPVDAHDASSPDGGSSDGHFPSELPVFVDAATDSPADVEAGFPIEK